MHPMPVSVSKLMPPPQVKESLFRSRVGYDLIKAELRLGRSMDMCRTVSEFSKILESLLRFGDLRVIR